MKTVNVRTLQRKVRKSVKASQKDSVVVTRNGKPAAVIIGLEGQDWESVVMETSAPFWSMIQRRRKEKTLPWSEVRKRLRGSNK